jgi:hypothetical protein
MTMNTIENSTLEDVAVLTDAELDQVCGGLMMSDPWNPFTDARGGGAMGEVGAVLLGVGTGGLVGTWFGGYIGGAVGGVVGGVAAYAAYEAGRHDPRR